MKTSVEYKICLALTLAVRMYDHALAAHVEYAVCDTTRRDQMTTPEEPHTRQYSHINGTVADLHDRLVVSELCKGWAVYRDASEWMNFRSLFADDATVWTTWSGPRKIDDFISISKAGKAAGAFIQHRECGTLVELNREVGRALGKMKATITQRFTSVNGGPAFDVDCDCRFLFFCEAQPVSDIGQPHTKADAPNGKVVEGEMKPKPEEGPSDEQQCDASAATISSGTMEDRSAVDQEVNATSGNVQHQAQTAWKVRFVKLVYEKDRVVPVDGRSAPTFPDEVLAKYPEGYRYLGAAQASLGYEVDTKLATVKDQDTWGRMYSCMENWLAGAKDPGLFWE
ncbi:Pea pathogenicity protein 2 like [Verticillium longisporum]|uniref:Pea pathogenicity protein 2 like n=1 Tax=Verticillium longisporum TaxID=100787 RepID=A0A8I2ZWB1_VERLO|nr:Palmitoyltransferase ERF2 [Verticillium dahliae VDG1]KAG7139251.1 Pea pathogenicity protein 2 like [Verticillium longisporum]RBQ78226.1 hypothetical protein VDGD_09615 [Verticillium dahliae]